MMSELIREALLAERKTYTWWLYCRHASIEERRYAHDQVQRINAELLLQGEAGE